MTRTKPADRLTGRTKMITVASIGAVGLAGLFAVGANLGILTSTDQSNVGTVSAAGDLVPADARTEASPGSQRFAVDGAGTVDVRAGAGLARLDRVTPARGWTARSVSVTGADVAVAFTDGARNLQFTANASAGGTVLGDVTESVDATPAARAETRQRDDDEAHGSKDHGDEDHGYEGGDADD